MTTLSVEVLNYKDVDGGFRRAECSIDFINTGYASILEVIRKKVYVPLEEHQISLYVLHAEKVEIRAVKKGHDGRPLVDASETVTTLVTDECYEIREIARNSVETLIKLLTQYSFNVEGDGSNREVRNEAMSNFLKMTLNAKIRSLDDLLSLYLGFNCQNYFDFVSYIILSGSYTWSSIFAVMSLMQSSSGPNLRGKTLAINAVRKEIVVDGFRVPKSEIHTTSGLSIIYQKLFRLRFPRVRVFVDVQYVPLVITDADDMVRSNQPVIASSPINPEALDEERIYAGSGY